MTAVEVGVAVTDGLLMRAGMMKMKVKEEE